MKRRSFLAAASAASLVHALPASVLALDPDNKYRKEIGIQLYTLRNQIAKDLPGAIRAVAEAGYHQVEPYGFPNAAKMIQASKDNGMKVNSSHFAWNSVVNPKDKGIEPFASILDKAHKAGLTHLVIPYLEERNRRTLDDYKRTAEKCNAGAEQAKAAGIQLAYHNHAFEFKPLQDGVTGYDTLIKEFSPAMKFEVDVFWVQVGGRNPAKLIRQLRGRVSQLHLKDLNKAVKTPNYGSIPPTAFEELGDGVIPMEPIFAAAESAEVSHCHVEQDHSPHPVKSIQQSMTHLKKL